MPKVERNRVIIRIWTSGWNTKYPGQDVGHVSIETTTPKAYYSLWPKDRVKGFETVRSDFKLDYAEDKKAEGERDPECAFCLYSLNAIQIRQEFNKIRKLMENNGSGWRLKGGNILLRELKNTSQENCASLAYQLLKAGGIYDLVSSTFSSKLSLIASPDAIVSLVKSAKRYEQKHYPETKQFKPKDIKETKVEEETRSCSTLRWLIGLLSTSVFAYYLYHQRKQCLTSPTTINNREKATASSFLLPPSMNDYICPWLTSEYNHSLNANEHADENTEPYTIHTNQ